MIERLALVLISMGACLAGGALPAFAQSAKLTGEAMFRERIALPPDAVFEAVLEDVSRADAPAGELGRARVEPAPNPPIRFEIAYDPALVSPRGRYHVRATIRRAGERLMFTTTDAYPALTRGAPATVQLLLRMLPPAAPGLSALPATYRGELPRADCSGIHDHLNLHEDGLFALRLEYRDRPGVFDDIGSWRLEGGELSLTGQRGETEKYALMADGVLRKLDTEGRPIESAMNYDLRRAPAFEGFEARTELRGMFRYMADSGHFTECRSGARLPVAHERENPALERAYGEANLAAGPELLVEIEGRIVSRPPMEGDGAIMALVVDRFVRARPGETCAGGVEGTHWRLTALHGAAVHPPPNRPAPHLTIENDRAAGSDGCNRFMGPAEIDGEKIRLGPLAGTLMACTDYPGAEEMGPALAAARTWRRAADRLELLGEDGAVVAAFVAE